MNRFLIFEINQIESINWRQYENVQIFHNVDSFFISTHLIFIIFSQNCEITLLVDRQISRIDRIDFNREKDKKIEFNWFCWLDSDEIHISLDIITLDHRLDDHDSFVSVVELLKNHVRLWRRHCWIDEKRHLRYRIDSKIDETTKMKWSERWKRIETVIN
jgi:hypothetical protein